MFLPIGDSPNPRGTPWVTWTLIALNIAAFVFVNLPLSGPLSLEQLSDPSVRRVLDTMWELQEPALRPLGIVRSVWETKVLSRYDVFVFEHGYKPGMPELSDLMACMFLHGGLMHLAGNMLYLWIFGDNIEARIGPAGYLVTYLVTGICGTLAFAFVDGGSLTPLVGASGAISGVLGCYFVWFRTNTVKVLMVFFPFLMQVLRIPAFWVLLFYFVVQNLFPAMSGQQSGVAYLAHIGGFLSGAGAALLLGRLLPAPSPEQFEERQDPEWAPRSRRGSARVVPPPPSRRSTLGASHDPTVRFEQYMRGGRIDEAAREFARIARGDGVTRLPRDIDVFALGEWLIQRGFHPDAEVVFRYYLRHYPIGHHIAQVHLRLGELLAGPLGRPTPARQHLLDAIDLAPPASPIPERARRLLHQLGD